MKNSTIKDIVMVGVFAGFAYYVSRYYRQKKPKREGVARNAPLSIILIRLFGMFTWNLRNDAAVKISTAAYLVALIFFISLRTGKS